MHVDPRVQLADVFLAAFMTNEESTSVKVASSKAAHVADVVPVDPDNVIVTVI